MIVAHCPPLAPERRPRKAALGLVLAADVESSIDVPPWDNAAVDGFAVRAADLGPGHAPLEVIEEVAAGQFPQRTVGPGTAIRVATGAPVPEGADTVVRQEDVDSHATRVCVRVQAPTGDHVRRRGGDCRRGDRVLAAGTALGPAALGVLASIAHATPLVRPSPRVAFFGGGDEVAGLDRADDILAGRKIASANSYALFALIQAAGGVPSISDSRWTLERASASTSSAPRGPTSSSPQRG